ncbi:hypothetical protein RQN9TF_12575 [Rhodococcus qingshengii]|uniref:hypothetical protein n=1 Tax=Rhodococcus TaxID=1827 RepID=UPI000F61E927|nr:MULTISPECIES: hypothetical protein [Rhodococcus]AZI61828.1 hypothetical protein EHW12_12115 [Rhodococcus sp. NJ-530]BDQ20039.1 hypothetical protein RQN9TF_12575 [Rhodococcus qingshengii]
MNETVKAVATVLGLIAFVAGVIGIGFAIWWGLSSLVAAEIKSDNLNQQRQEEWRKDPVNPINICIAKGGVPLKSSWTGDLKECQFPEAKS